jgi:hypothetical protein
MRAPGAARILSEIRRRAEEFASAGYRMGAARADKNVTQG